MKLLNNNELDQYPESRRMDIGRNQINKIDGLRNSILILNITYRS